MADNLTTQTTVSTVPNGTVIATDDAGAGGHVQVVKLAISTDGSATAIPADAANGIDVDVTRLPALPAGTNNIGDVDVLTLPAVTNAGVFAVQVDGNALTALQLIDDTVAVLGTATYTEAATKGNVVAAVRRDADTTLADTTNEIAPLQVDARGALKVEVFSGETLPVSGTVTANLAAGTNNIGDVDILSIAAGDNNIGNVDIVTMPTVTVNAHAVTNAGTFVTQVDGAALTALQLIDNLVVAEDAPAAGGESGVQVLGVRKDAAGTLASLDGDFTPFQMDSAGNVRVNVAAGGAGDGSILDGVSSAIKATVLDYVNSNPLAVRLSDVNGDYVGAGAGTQYTEDAVAAADPVGTQLISRRRDTLSATEVSLDGDVIAVNASNKGELYVKHADTLNVAVTSQVPGTGATNLGKAEDAVHASGDVGVMALSVRRDANTAFAADGDYAPLQTDVQGFLKVIVSDSINLTTTVASITAGDNNIGNVDVLTLPALVAGTANIGDVDVLTLPDVIAVGKAAHDAAAAGNPVQVAGTHETPADSAPTNRLASVTDGDVQRFSTVDGAMFVIPTGPQMWSYHENSSLALTDTAVHAAPGAGLSLYITDIVVSTGAATAFNVFFEEGAATVVLGPYYLEAVAGRGFAIHFGTPKKITANTGFNVTTSAAIAHGIDVTGFIAPG